MTTTAFVLSGGGSLGAVQVGMLQALCAQDDAPNLLVGTSAGAINAAYIAEHGFTTQSLDNLARVWGSMRRSDIFPINLVRNVLAVWRGRDSFFSHEGLRRVIAEHTVSADVLDTQIPLHVVATDLRSGEEVLISSGDLVSAVLASAAIPGIFPPVRREGRILVDGGLTDNTAISQAVALGAERIVVLPAGVACALKEPPKGPLAIAMVALTFLTQQRLISDITRYRGPHSPTARTLSRATRSRHARRPGGPLWQAELMKFDLEGLPESVLDELGARHLATLATSRANGTTHLVPVGFTYDPLTKTARVTTSVTSVKVRNIERVEATGGSARASICQLDGPSWLTLEGTIRVSLDPDEIAEAVRRYAVRYRQPRENPRRVALIMQVDSMMGHVMPTGG